MKYLDIWDLKIYFKKLIKNNNKKSDLMKQESI